MEPPKGWQQGASNSGNQRLRTATPQWSRPPARAQWRRVTTYGTRARNLQAKGARFEPGTAHSTNLRCRVPVIRVLQSPEQTLTGIDSRARSGVLSLSCCCARTGLGELPTDLVNG
jgi:hypothetical protein